MVPAQISTLPTRNQPSHFQAGEFSSRNGSQFSEFLQPQAPMEEGWTQSSPVSVGRLWAARDQLPSPTSQLIFTGLEAQTPVSEESQPEGSTLYVQCPYTAQTNYQQPKVWCRWRDGQCEFLVGTRYSTQNANTKRATREKVTIEDNSTNRIVTITITKLQVEDSGTYSCAYTYGSQYFLLKIISLIVFKGEYLFPYSNAGLVTKQHHSCPCSIPPTAEQLPLTPSPLPSLARCLPHTHSTG